MGIPPLETDFFSHPCVRLSTAVRSRRGVRNVGILGRRKGRQAGREGRKVGRKERGREGGKGGQPTEE